MAGIARWDIERKLSSAAGNDVCAYLRFCVATGEFVTSDNAEGYVSEEIRK
jgi:hypothetical protein